MTNYDNRYDDIINLPPPTSEKHPKMPIPDRAAQFAPFSAVVGPDDAVREVARGTEKRIELDDEAIRILDQKLHTLCAILVTRPAASITYYQNDAKKEGVSWAYRHGVSIPKTAQKCINKCINCIKMGKNGAILCICA